MTELGALGRKPRRLRHLRRHLRQELQLELGGRAARGTEAAGPAAAPAEPEPVKSEQGVAWRGAEPGERSKKAQLDRLDINVQIDDSYLVEAGDRQKRWQCRMCEKSYTSKYNLVTHILGHNGIKPHSCPHCNKLFKQPSHLQTHLLTHEGTRPHKCEVCSKAFTQTSHLKRHMLLHSDIKPYSCRFCGRGFAYPSELKAHEVKHEHGRCHVCVECGLDFSTLTQLKRHLSTHQGPTLYQCLECSKSFHYRSQLQNHMLKHQNVRPFVCTECGMEFSQIHHLKQHSLTHKVGPVGCTSPPGDGERGWPHCGLCEWVTGQAPAAAGTWHHWQGCLATPGLPAPDPRTAPRQPCPAAALPRSRSWWPLQGVKEFKCEVCGREFTLQANMKRHMLIHTSVRPYQCHICFKTFVQKQTLKTHMIVHSPVKPFKCKVPRVSRPLPGSALAPGEAPALGDELLAASTASLPVPGSPAPHSCTLQSSVTQQGCSHSHTLQGRCHGAALAPRAHTPRDPVARPPAVPGHHAHQALAHMLYKLQPGKGCPSPPPCYSTLLEIP
uniref:Zinc finger protein 710 n=1 Tax=Nothoprocta perdicaria TaxID=30464 RepID=A0A8C6ZJ37_NOTPE